MRNRGSLGISFINVIRGSCQGSFSALRSFQRVLNEMRLTKLKRDYRDWASYEDQIENMSHQMD